MTNYTQILPSPVERRGLVLFPRGIKIDDVSDAGTCTAQAAADDRVFRRTYNLRSPINIQPPPGQGRVLSRRSLGSNVPAPIALHLGAQAHG